MNSPNPTPVELTPPQSFALEAPQAVAVVPVDSASGKIKLKPEDVHALDAQVRSFVAEVAGANQNDPAFRATAERLHALGNKEIEASSSVSNRLLERSVSSLSSGAFGSSTKIGNGLIDLRRTIESLDPSRQGDLFAPRKLLGLIPFGNKLADYFDRYQSSQNHLNAIVAALKHGKDELMRDNAAVEQEKVNLWTLMEKLEKYIYLGRQLDTELDARAQALDGTDPDKARVIREELLFYARQKVTDLLTQLSVNVQGYLALDLVRKNNLELIKGVDRATTTTVAALRTAVIVAQALGNQKLVLDQITALNSTTGNLIASTSELLRDQSAAVHQQAASSTIEIAKLQQAFQNVYQAMDAMSDYKVKALDAMQRTVDTLTEEVGKSRTYLERARRQESAAGPARSNEVVL